MTYSEKLKKLKLELSVIVSKMRQNKKHLTEDQQKVYDFVLGKKEIIQIEREGIQYLIARGNSSKGFEHIITKHYDEGCIGCISANEILNIGKTIKNGNYLPDGFSRTIGNDRLFVIHYDENAKDIKWVVTYYSNRVM